MRMRIARVYLGGAFLLLLAVWVALDFYVSGTLFDRQVQNLRERLLLEARTLSAAPGPPAGNIQAWAAGAASGINARVTVLDSHGAVLADSGQDPETAGNADDPEVRAALAGRAANAIRQSGASQEEFLYVAAPLENQAAAAAALRLAQSLEPLHAQSRDLLRRLLGISLLSLALAGALVLFFLRSLRLRIWRLENYAENLLDPQVSAELLPAGDDPLGALAKSLQRTAPRIRELVENLKLEGAHREAILASMTEGVLAVDEDQRVIFCNQAFAGAVSARSPVSPGMQLLELVRDPDFREIISAVLASGERVQRRITLPAAQGHSFEVTAGPLAGPAPGALAILRDVTELERLERVRKDFVANVSHELRTPLAAIHGYAETLLQGALEDQQNNRRFVEVIQAQAARLNSIAADLLTLSELESHGPAPLLKPVSVRAALQSALHTVESAARLRGVRLVCGRIEDLRVLGEELRLEQVFVNLLDNAVKFNRPNGEVTVEAASQDGQVRITIADSGIGIPSEDLPRIFERFYRVDKARSRELGGTGLGLSIVKHVTEQMGGTVTVDSRLGEGSRFTLVVPRSKGSEEALPPPL